MKHPKSLLLTVSLMLFLLNSLDAQSPHWRTVGNGTTGPDPITTTSFIGTTVALPFNIKTTLAQSINFFTSNTRRMTITPTGFVKIGPNFTPPDNLLDVVGGDIDVHTPVNGYKIGNNFVLWHKGDISNIFVGVGAGLANATGVDNTFVGNNAGLGNTSGTVNTFVGTQAGERNTIGSENVFLGTFAGNNNSSGNSNTYVGDRAGLNDATGNNNTFLGHHAGASYSSGNGNVSIGYHSTFSSVATGSNNTIVGTRAVSALTSGGGNCLLGG